MFKNYACELYFLLEIAKLTTSSLPYYNFSLHSNLSSNIWKKMKDPPPKKKLNKAYK